MRKILLLAAAVSLAAAAQAQAHARLIHATPKVGEHVAVAPKVLRLAFSETIDVRQSSVTVTGPGHAVVVTGRLALDAKDRRVVIAPLPAGLAKGPYHVAWRATSADMHHTEGDYAFTVN